MVSTLWASACFLWVVSLVPAVARAQQSASSPDMVAVSAPSAPQNSERTGHPVLAKPGFSLLAAAGSGTNTDKVHRVHLEPYAASFGLMAGYTFQNGVHLGLYTHYALGRSVTQEYVPRFGKSWTYNADSTSLSAGGAVAYDLPLYMFVLRYTLNLGFTRFTWDFDEEQGRVPPGFGGRPQGTQYGFHLGPALALLWSWRVLQCGVVYEYLIQLQAGIPSGLVGKVVLGVKL